MSNSKQIVYLSQSQYAELIANGSITVDGVTVTYNENDIYVTPQAEPVTDVRVAGTSVAVNGVANVPAAGDNTFGAVKVATGGFYGIKYYNNNDQYKFLVIKPSEVGDVKKGVLGYQPIVPDTQHYSAFYGLAKAAGHDEASSTEPLGTYTPEAKAAIQQMLGVSSLIAPIEPTLVASKAYAVGDVFTANGKLYKVTTAIAAAETIVVQNEGEEVSGHNAVETSLSDGFVKFTDYATSNKAGVVSISGNRGIAIDSTGNTFITGATTNDIKPAANTYKPIVPSTQHISTFYGLAKAAGDTTQSASSNAVGTYTNEAKAAIKSMIGVNVEDVQVNGISIISGGVANVPLAIQNGAIGVVKIGGDVNGLAISGGTGNLYIVSATSSQIKDASSEYRPVVPYRQHEATFYGLAKASGDTTQSASSNAVGTYTDSAKASIKSMLGIVDGSTGTVTVTGTTPTITAVENTRYVCGEVATLTITPPASGICIIRFTSGTTATVLTATGVVWPEWFDATALEASRVYEICITDGYGAVMSWAL